MNVSKKIDWFFVKEALMVEIEAAMEQEKDTSYTILRTAAGAQKAALMRVYEKLAKIVGEAV